VIALLGASGAVGRHALAALERRGVRDVRTGSRSSGVDFDDDAALASFVRGADVVVNCAGPSHRSAQRVARAAVAAGADHVDAGGTDAVVDPRGRRVVFDAGASPGLSGLVPRWLSAQGFESVHGLTAYCGVLDRFTEAGAEDYLHGTGEPLAAWRSGWRSGALVRLSDVELPFFAGPVAALPFLDAECEAVARSLSLVDGRWYSVVEGPRLRHALDRVHGLAPADAVRVLCDAAALDVAGRTQHLTYLVQLDGVADGKEISRTAVLRAGGVAELTGFVTAAAVLAVLGGEIPPGVHRAATVLDPMSTVDQLDLMVVDTTIAELAVAEEGVL
jgi:hypothetical protein